VLVSSVTTQWPGATAEQVEQLVTRPIESTLAENSFIRPPTPADFGIKSLSMPGLSIIQVQLIDTAKDPKKEFNDLSLKLNSLTLPQGAGPIKFNSDFGDTAALMLTIASPLEDRTTIPVRAHAVQQAIVKHRAERRDKARGSPVTIVQCYPDSVPQESVARLIGLFRVAAESNGVIRDGQMIAGPGFMAVLGIASLIGVIVSHVMVLFDFIEEMHEKGEPLEQALLDAGIVRLRPVMITVGATILALFPLAIHGGPLWQPLCYAQIGGLGVATFITLLMVPVLYSIFVLDLKIVKWGAPGDGAEVVSAEAPHGEGH
jgi:multidrug efflux pump subunit AcrB